MDEDEDLDDGGKCPDCKGSGQIPHPLEVDSTIVSESVLDCQRCGGTGRLPIDQLEQ